VQLRVFILWLGTLLALRIIVSYCLVFPALVLLTLASPSLSRNVIERLLALMVLRIRKGLLEFEDVAPD